MFLYWATRDRFQMVLDASTSTIFEWCQYNVQYTLCTGMRIWIFMMDYANCYWMMMTRLSSDDTKWRSRRDLSWRIRRGSLWRIDWPCVNVDLWGEGRNTGESNCRPIVWWRANLKEHLVCLNSLRVVSPGVQRRKSTRKDRDPVTRTESLVLTRLPPRAVEDSVSIQWSCVVKF